MFKEYTTVLCLIVDIKFKTHFALKYRFYKLFNSLTIIGMIYDINYHYDLMSSPAIVFTRFRPH